MIKIYGQPNSSAGRCFWTMEELGLKYEVVPLNMREREHRSQSYLKLNPNGKIPCLVDDDIVLWESMAINHYLCEKYQPTLLGTSLSDRAKVMQWSYWAIAEYQRPVIDLFIQKVFVPEAKRDQSFMEKCVEKIAPLNAVLDDALLGRNYLIHHDFTVADLNVASVAKLMVPLNIDLTPYSSLTTWLAKVTSRPACRKVAAMAEKK